MSDAETDFPRWIRDIAVRVDERVAAPDVPYHFSIGDEHCRPSERRIRKALIRTLEFEF